MNKNHLFICLISILLFSLSCQNNDKASEPESQDKLKLIKTENLSIIYIDVEGMACKGCEKAIVKNVEKLDGIVKVEASHTDGKVVIEFDKSKLDTNQLKARIEDIGYIVVSIRSKKNK